MARGRKHYVPRRAHVARGGPQGAQVPPQPRPVAVVLNDNFDEGFEITADDLRNSFFVKVNFPALSDVSESAMSYGVVGRYTVDLLGRKVAYRLWEVDQVLSSECAVDLFENGALLSSETTMAELLKEARKARRGDGVSLIFECAVTGVWGGTYFDD
jgi:hypothetical protein